MDAKVEGLAATIKDQQARIENLTGRIIRLETALEIALSAQGTNVSSNRIEHRFSRPLNRHADITSKPSRGRVAGRIIGIGA